MPDTNMHYMKKTRTFLI